MLIKIMLAVSLALMPLQLLAETAKQETPSGKELIRTNCLGCHIPTDEGFSRISLQRKTPEGWEMSISRMLLMHGLKISNLEIPVNGSAMHEMVKYLADTQGLAPEETEGFRYLLEQDLNRVEDVDPQLAVMCGRCHSAARTALQRRTKDEWQYLINFHVGQFPSIEYSLYGRDRDWLNQANTEVVPMLSQQFSLQNTAWAQWQNSEKPQLQGRWVLSGHAPGNGFFSAVMSVSQDKKDYYSLSIEGRYNDGTRISGTGKAIVYTGFEWRGNINFGDQQYRQVLAANADGETMTGRFYQKGQDLVGMKITALKDTSKTQLLSIFPSHIQRGKTALVTITGSGLTHRPVFSDGIVVQEIISQEKNSIVARIKAQSDAISGYAGIQVGSATLDNHFAIYSNVNALQVEPSYGIARIGNNGGNTPKVNTVFRAIGIDYGKDAIAGTADDINLGYMDNITWEVVPRDAVAEKDQDVKFAGTMDKNTGIFSPAAAGPNPKRYRSTNNAGNLNVVARLSQPSGEVTGSGRLLVTVQRWNDPPLK